MIFLLAACRPLLALYIGDQASSTPGLLDGAVSYVMIRALSMPTTLLLGVLQAALLGARDSVTPLIAILYSTIVRQNKTSLPFYTLVFMGTNSHDFFLTFRLMLVEIIFW